MTDDGPTRYTWLDFNAPLSDRRAARLAATLAATGPRHVLDLGCGWGELLLRTLEAAPAATGTGVDLDPLLLARGRTAADARGLAGRVTFVEADVATYATPAPGPADADASDAVICVGASHAFGGAAQALRALRMLVGPGGRLLYGDTFWQRPPTGAQAAALGESPDDAGDLADLADAAVAAGFRPLRIESAGHDEWEAFESGYLADWEAWLLRTPDGPAAAEARAKADAHRTRWLRGYRGLLGFAYLTLGVPAGR